MAISWLTSNHITYVLLNRGLVSARNFALSRNFPLRLSFLAHWSESAVEAITQPFHASERNGAMYMWQRDTGHRVSAIYSLHSYHSYNNNPSQTYQPRKLTRQTVTLGWRYHPVSAWQVFHLYTVPDPVDQPTVAGHKNAKARPLVVMLYHTHIWNFGLYPLSNSVEANDANTPIVVESRGEVLFS